MSLSHPFGPELLAVYAAVFGLAAATCLALARTTRSIENEEARTGLRWLLYLSGTWAAAQVGFLLAPSPTLQEAFYVAGLVVGLATVGPWLYFCLAFTGRSLHRAPALRRFAVAAFLAITVVKVTNPFHHLYYTTAVSEGGVLVVGFQPMHWIAMGLAYALATVGYFTLLELFWSVGHGTRMLAVLVAVTGLPVILDVVAVETDWLLALNYEPLGVAVFAVGVLVAFREDFQTVRLTGARDEPVVVVSEDGRVRDFNDRAVDLLSELAVGAQIDEVAPAVGELLRARAQDGDDGVATELAGESAVDAVPEVFEDGADVVRLDSTDEGRYFRVDVAPVGAAGARGKIITFSDVTEREEYRRALERQNERLEQFASVVSHDLRNPLNVAMGRVELAREGRADDEDLAGATAAMERMDALIEDLLSLAREGQTIDETQPCDLGELADRAWAVVASEGATMTVRNEVRVAADPERLQQLLENLFRNAVEHGGRDVAITIGALPAEPGFSVADDGPGIPPDEREEVLEFGRTTVEGGTGFGLAIVAEIVEAHGWSMRVTESPDGGARFEIRTAGAGGDGFEDGEDGVDDREDGVEDNEGDAADGDR